MITPAISVLSAVEGIKVIALRMDSWIVPLTAVIIVALFSVQRHGTGAVGRFFGPVMIAWFTAIGACGVTAIADNPEILKALSPIYAVKFMVGHFHFAFFSLAAVVLSVTGAEAIYADMGHFGRRAITSGWLLLVLPGSALSYLGQGALLLKDSTAAGAPFFLLVPDWARLPMVHHHHHAAVPVRRPDQMVGAAVGTRRRRRGSVIGRSNVPGGQPDQTGARGLAAVADRGDRVHRNDYLAARSRDRHRHKGTGRRIIARVRRRPHPPGAALHPGAGNGDLHEPWKRDHAVGDAGQCRTQPCVARAGGHHGGRHFAGAAGARNGADRRRRSRLCQRRHHSRNRPLRLHGDAGYPRRPASARTQPDRGSDRPRRRLLLLVQARTRQRSGAHHGSLRKRLFIATSYTTADAAQYFALPPERTVVMGSRIEV